MALLIDISDKINGDVTGTVVQFRVSIYLDVSSDEPCLLSELCKAFNYEYSVSDLQVIVRKTVRERFVWLNDSPEKGTVKIWWKDRYPDERMRLMEFRITCIDVAEISADFPDKLRAAIISEWIR